MLFSLALLSFLFSSSTAVVEARYWAKPPIHKRPPDTGFAPPHIPPASYGYWVRCDIDNPEDRASDDEINDVMRLYENDNGEVGLYELPDTKEPTFPTFVRALRDRSLAILIGEWIRFPIYGASVESRWQRLTAEIVNGVQFAVSIDPFSISIQPSYILRERFVNGYFYPLGGSASLNLLLQFTDTAVNIRFWSLRPPSHDFPSTILTRISNPSAADVDCIWFPYPMRRTPRADRNRALQATKTDDRITIVAFKMHPAS